MTSLTEAPTTMAHTPDPNSRELGLEIDRLLKKLPDGGRLPTGGVEVIVEGPSAPRPAPRRSAAVAAAAASVAAAAAAPANATSSSYERDAAAARRRTPAKGPPTWKVQLSVWWRVALAACLGIAVTQWPYLHDCGQWLYAFVAVVGTVQLAGAWASIWAWRLRIAAAHIIALGIVFWGIVLAAEVILPRIGYAASAAGWACGG